MHVGNECAACMSHYPLHRVHAAEKSSSSRRRCRDFVQHTILDCEWKRRWRRLLLFSRTHLGSTTLRYKSALDSYLVDLRRFASIRVDSCGSVSHLLVSRLPSPLLSSLPALCLQHNAMTSSRPVLIPTAAILSSPPPITGTAAATANPTATASLFMLRIGAAIVRTGEHRCACRCLEDVLQGKGSDRQKRRRRRRRTRTTRVQHCQPPAVSACSHTIAAALTHIHALVLECRALVIRSRADLLRHFLALRRRRR